MLALQQLALGVHDGAAAGSERIADQRTMAGHLQELLQQGLVVATNTVDRAEYALTDAGKRRLRMLTIDLARELESLQDATRAMIRAALVPLALDGVRRVVFYPFGETAEMAYTVVTGLGLDVVGIVDDSPRKWGVRFHGLQVLPATTLPSLAPDAVLVTSAVFQEAILTKLRALPLEGVRIHIL